MGEPAGKPAARRVSFCNMPTEIVLVVGGQRPLTVEVQNDPGDVRGKLINNPVAEFTGKDGESVFVNSRNVACFRKKREGDEPFLEVY